MDAKKVWLAIKKYWRLVLGIIGFVGGVIIGRYGLNGRRVHNDNERPGSSGSDHLTAGELARRGEERAAASRERSAESDQRNEDAHNRADGAHAAIDEARKILEAAKSR